MTEVAQMMAHIEMAELTGSETQVKQADDIRKWFISFMAQYQPTDLFYRLVNAKTSAKWWIGRRDYSACELCGELKADAVYYDYLMASATSADATQEDIDKLGEWFSSYGERYWNGESYDADGLRLFPIYAEVDHADIVGYEFR